MAQGRITVWDQTRPDAPTQVAFPHGSLNDLQFSPDERLLAIASADLGLYATAASVPPRLLRSDYQNYGTAQFSQDGQNLLVITGAGEIQTLDARSGALRLKVCCSSIYGEVTFTPDGQAIACAGHWPSLWDARTGQLIARLTAEREFYTFRPIAFETDGGLILMGSQDGRVYVWDLQTNQLLAVSPAQSTYVDTLAASRNGLVIFAGFGDSVQFWNFKTGQRRPLAGARPTSNLIVAPDGDTIVFGTAEGVVEWWDVRTGRRLRAITMPNPLDTVRGASLPR